MDKARTTTQRLVKSNGNLELLGYVLVTLLLFFSLQNIIIIISVIVIVITHVNLG